LIQQTTKYVLDNYQKVMQGKDISSPLLQFLKDVSIWVYLASSTRKIRSDKRVSN